MCSLKSQIHLAVTVMKVTVDVNWDIHHVYFSLPSAGLGMKHCYVDAYNARRQLDSSEYWEMLKPFDRLSLKDIKIFNIPASQCSKTTRPLLVLVDYYKFYCDELCTWNIPHFSLFKPCEIPDLFRITMCLTFFFFYFCESHWVSKEVGKPDKNVTGIYL